MGVPAFFRWLSRKYPSVIVNCIEEKNTRLDGTFIPVDSSQPNPNGVEFDNLYLDMNGIIHPCTHPEDKPAPKNEDEMMVAIFECIDRLFRIVRPRKLLYMAIDGVAPRAKMNQQRSRRFRASKETVEKIQEIARVRKEMSARGLILPPEKAKEAHFDSNCITPGTPFMARLSNCLHYYIHDRLNNDPGWRNIKVILSDANVPGEGEHKIMDYIRRQRAQPDHDPNTQHCLCGADADLIMLGLATHEPNFTIIREEFKPNKPKTCDICGQEGHEMKDCIGLTNEVSDPGKPVTMGEEQQFIFVRLNVLREYLERELEMPGLPFEYDFERAVDDWVFMCFFVGNDFLPHLPSLEIREGAIDRLVNLYKKTVTKTGGFITDSGNVTLDRVQLIMTDLGDVEDEIFKNRQQTELMFKQRDKMRKRREKQQNMRHNFQGPWAPQPVGQNVGPMYQPRQEAYHQRVQHMHSQSAAGSYNSPPNQSNRGQKRTHDDVDEGSEEEEAVNDEVRLWESGFKDRYYESKFDVGSDNLAFRYKVALEYVKGLCWVLKYYYQGCPSWKWYFPYHYAPFASDFINIGSLDTDFEMGTQPFKPLEQLMGVFPAASSAHVPAPWAHLMSDPDSPIIDFYPEDFKIDLNGKKFAWQGVALLPFVEEERLFKALEPFYRDLTPAEIRRNVRGDDRLYMNQAHTCYSFLMDITMNEANFSNETSLAADGMRGSVLISEDKVKEGGSLPSPVEGLSVIRMNAVICVRFRDPKYPDSFIFPAKRLSGAIEPPRVLKPGNLSREDSNNWRPQTGFVRSNQRGSLNAAGHRMLGRYSGRFGGGRGGSQDSSPGVYSSVPPPPNGFRGQPYRQDDYQGPSRNRGNRDGRYQPFQRNSGGFNSSNSSRGSYNSPSSGRDSWSSGGSGTHIRFSDSSDRSSGGGQTNEGGSWSTSQSSRGGRGGDNRSQSSYSSSRGSSKYGGAVTYTSSNRGGGSGGYSSSRGGYSSGQGGYSSSRGGNSSGQGGYSNNQGSYSSGQSSYSSSQGNPSGQRSKGYGQQNLYPPAPGYSTSSYGRR
uniref:5'-3' exoribonuclease n=1 Tax=Homalodisca liturata TaxID=320908 RepID=A0A1B6K3S3_9HEMI